MRTFLFSIRLRLANIILFFILTAERLPCTEHVFTTLPKFMCKIVTYISTARDDSCSPSEDTDSKMSVCNLGKAQRFELCRLALRGHDYCVHNGFRSIPGEPEACFRYTIVYRGIRDAIRAFKCPSEPTMYLSGTVDTRIPLPKRIVWIIVDENSPAPYLIRKRKELRRNRGHVFGNPNNRHFLVSV